MTLALLCSGQGLQHPAMFALTAQEPRAQPIFEAARAHLEGQDPRRIAAEAPEAALHSNTVAQVLCCTQALAAFAVLDTDMPRSFVIAGYSVGEWAAWCCAGCLAPGLVFDLVRLRARLMDDASGPDGGLAAVRGLPRDRIEALCRAHDAAVAIVNPGDLVIVGGLRRDLDALCDAARTMGASRAHALNVFTPSHTPRLAGAVAPLAAALEEAGGVTPPRPGVRLLSGADGGSVRGGARDRAALARQVATPLDWAAALQAVAETGVDTVFELGPGGALADMARAAIPNATARSLDDFRSLAAVRAWLARIGSQ